MAARDRLEMIRIGVSYCRAAGADQRNALSDELFRDDNAKMGAGDLYLTPGSVGVEKDEQLDRPVASQS